MDHATLVGSKESAETMRKPPLRGGFLVGRIDVEVRRIHGGDLQG